MTSKQTAFSILVSLLLLTLGTFLASHHIINWSLATIGLGLLTMTFISHSRNLSPKPALIAIKEEQ